MSPQIKKSETFFVTILQYLNYFLLFICLGILPALSIWIGRSLTVNGWDGTDLFTKALADKIVYLFGGFGLVTFLLRLLYIVVKNEEERELTEFWSEIYFIYHHAHSAWR